MNDGIMSTNLTVASQAIKKAITIDRDNPLKHNEQIRK